MVILGVTGSITEFEPELDRSLHPQLSDVTPGRQELSLSEIGDAVSRRFGGEPVVAYLPSLSPNLSSQVLLPSGIAYVNRESVHWKSSRREDAWADLPGLCAVTSCWACERRLWQKSFEMVRDRDIAVPGDNYARSRGGDCTWIWGGPVLSTDAEVRWRLQDCSIALLYPQDKVAGERNVVVLEF